MTVNVWQLIHGVISYQGFSPSSTGNILDIGVTAEYV
jgi:hypothetical protein